MAYTSSRVKASFEGSLRTLIEASREIGMRGQRLAGGLSYFFVFTSIGFGSNKGQS